MTVSLKHTFASAKTDSADATLVQPSNWNAEHQLTLATNKVLGRATAGTGAAEELSVGTALSISGGTLAVTNVPVANGGTGAATLTGYVKGTGTLPLTGSASVPVGDISGTLPVASGGTGATTLTANNVLLGNGTSALQVVAPGAVGNQLTSNGTTWTSVASATGPIIEFARQYITQTTVNFTVPANVTNIRIYACGKGSDGVYFSGGGGGGGGFGFGTLAVTAGDVINVTISSGVATVARSATTHITANPGGTPGGGLGGAGGTASISGSLTTGGAYTGGNGGNTAALSNVFAAGGSAGSPLGNGFNGGRGLDANNAGGGGGIGGAGGSASGINSPSGGGGGAGGAGGAPNASGNTHGGSGGGAGAASTNGRPGQGRAILFTEPLLQNLNGSGGSGASTSSSIGTSGDSGGGGGGSGTGTSGTVGGNGGFGGGGGGGVSFGGWGGALGGGGGGNTGGSSLAGGGGGEGGTSGAGGPATVWIFY